MGIFDAIRKLLPFASQATVIAGDVVPEQPFPTPPAFDGRTAALRALGDYASALQYFREGPEGQPPIPFRLLRQNFHVDYPPKEVSLDYASGAAICVPTGKFTHEFRNFNDDRSLDEFGPNTVLQVTGTYEEQFSLEYRCALEQQRRAWKGQFEAAVVPVEDQTILRLRTRGYYGQYAEFLLLGGQLFDNADEARGRRAVQLSFVMRIDVVRLIPARRLSVVPAANVDVDEATGVAVALPPRAPSRQP